MLGDAATIVDMAVWGWARAVLYVLGTDPWEKLPNVKRLLDAVNARPAAQRAGHWLQQAHRVGRCRGINELHDLRRLHGEHGDAVEAWAAQQPTITRDRLTELRAGLERRAAAVPSAAATAVQSPTHDIATG